MGKWDWIKSKKKKPTTSKKEKDKDEDKEEKKEEKKEEAVKELEQNLAKQNEEAVSGDPRNLLISTAIPETLTLPPPQDPFTITSGGTEAVEKAQQDALMTAVIGGPPETRTTETHALAESVMGEDNRTSQALAQQVSADPYGVMSGMMNAPGEAGGVNEQVVGPVPQISEEEMRNEMVMVAGGETGASAGGPQMSEEEMRAQMAGMSEEEQIINQMLAMSMSEDEIRNQLAMMQAGDVSGAESVGETDSRGGESDTRSETASVSESRSESKSGSESESGTEALAQSVANAVVANGGTEEQAIIAAAEVIKKKRGGRPKGSKNKSKGSRSKSKGSRSKSKGSRSKSKGSRSKSKGTRSKSKRSGSKGYAPRKSYSTRSKSAGRSSSKAKRIPTIKLQPLKKKSRSASRSAARSKSRSTSRSKSKRSVPLYQKIAAVVRRQLSHLGVAVKKNGKTIMSIGDYGKISSKVISDIYRKNVLPSLYKRSITWSKKLGGHYDFVSDKDNALNDSGFKKAMLEIYSRYGCKISSSSVKSSLDKVRV
ncbi:hypothetical protein FACS189472_07050 [Alphaproteobacteria bacterium]|nr:hypothetical protein FACS189472_07050 [Alphaproteobacteria bacterium]